MIAGIPNPVIVKLRADGADADDATVRACINAGPFFIDGLADGLWIEPGSGITDAADATGLAFAILQATARRRMTATEYIVCPSCGRTLFDLQTTLAASRRPPAALRAEDRRDGLHSQRPGRNGRCRLRICRRGSRMCKPLQRQGNA